jgi:hypothetical protein
LAFHFILLGDESDFSQPLPPLNHASRIEIRWKPLGRAEISTGFLRASVRGNQNTADLCGVLISISVSANVIACSNVIARPSFHRASNVAASSCARAADIFRNRRDKPAASGDFYRGGEITERIKQR